MTKKTFFAEQAKFGYKTFYVEIKVGWLLSHKRECVVNKENIYRRAKHILSSRAFRNVVVGGGGFILLIRVEKNSSMHIYPLKYEKVV